MDEMDTGSWFEHFSKARSLWEDECYHEAVQECKKALEFNPDAGTHYYLALLLIDAEEYNEAIVTLHKSMKLGHDNLSGIHLNLGTCLENLNRLDEALLAYQESIRIDSNNPESFFKLGSLLSDMDNYEEAILAYQKSINIEPFANTYLNLGNALKNLGNHSDAISAYYQGIKLKPSDEDFYYNLGEALIKAKRPEEAVEVYEKSITINPSKKNIIIFRINLGVALSMIKERQTEALEVWQRVLSIDPDNSIVRKNIAALQREITNSIENSIGAFTFPNGAKYEGEFKNGMPHGQGTEFFLSGGKYVGEFKDGKRNGLGTAVYSDRNKYVGNWKDGVKQGKGTESYGNGSVYEGEFKNDMPHGQGTWIWDNGEKYEGEFEDGVQHGQGILTYPDGRKYLGRFKDGEPYTEREPDIKNSGCFIATAVYGSYDAPEVLLLQRFKNNYLLDSWVGKVFIKFYYTFSPFVVILLDKVTLLKPPIKLMLTGLVKIIASHLDKREID